MENKEIAIAWVDLTYRTNRFWFDKDHIILRNLNGFVNFGSITALMGPSGAGKTTLLNCLNGKNKSGLDTESKIYLNSNEKIQTSYIGQNVKEHLIMSLTAEQTLIYASKLKNSSVRERVNHKKNAMDLLSELILTDCQNTRVCDMSGGEQKRLTVAIELTQVIKPNFICMDEPTTGLDSNAAEIVMLCLKKLSESHKIAIITSIHQPNNDIFLMFDQIYVLANGGICVFFGPPLQLTSHLIECNLSFSSVQKPIEVLMKFASIADKTQTITELSQKSMNFMNNFDEKFKTQLKIAKNGVPFRSKSFYFADLLHLFMRSVLTDYVSQWKSLLMSLIIYSLIPILLISVYNPDLSDPDGCLTLNDTGIHCSEQLKEDSLLDESYKYMYLSVTLVVFIKLMSTTIVFHSQLKLFSSEHLNKFYSTTVFFITKSVIDLIPTVLQAIISGLITFYMTGLFSQTDRLLNFLLILITGLIAAQNISYIISIAFISNEMIALQMTIFMHVCFMLMDNSNFRLKQSPQLLQNMSFISIIKYVFNSFIILIYGCSPLKISKPLDKFNLTDDLFYEFRTSLIIYAFVLRLLFFLGLFWRTKSFDAIKYKINIRRITKIFQRDTPVLNVIISEDFEKVLTETERVEENPRQISIAWIDLTLKVKPFWAKQKSILNSLMGYFEFGTINALMGPSGAGKTTLLNCFNGKNKSKMTFKTQIYLNKFKTIRTSFISQDISDHLIRGLTAEESLVFAAMLKNNHFNDYNHKLMAQNIMNELIISDVKNTRTEDCSGGQQKRIVLGMELMSKTMPNLICIDEPTSGLDSNAAEAVIKCLRFPKYKTKVIRKGFTPEVRSNQSMQY